MPCPFGARQRCRALRGISSSLQHGHQPPAPLDSRRLADCPMASAAGARTGCAAHCQPTLRIVAMEDIRQPAAESGSSRLGAVAARQLDAAAGTGWHWAAARARDRCTARGLVIDRRNVSQTGGTAAAVASPGNGRVVRTPTRPGIPHLCVPALRRFYQSGCDQPDAAAVAHYPQTPAGMANRGRFRTRGLRGSRRVL